MTSCFCQTFHPKVINYEWSLMCIVFFSAGSDMELTFHDGTVRDLVFMQDTSNRSSLLISGGAGDCKIYVTDCETGVPIRVMAGHSG